MIYYPRPKTDPITASGYSAASIWCLSCDVSWPKTEKQSCWVCGKDDELYSWTYRSNSPVWEKVQIKEEKMTQGKRRK